MSDLTIPEKRKLEKFLDMRSGWVLNMPDKAFAELIAKSVGQNIFDARYNRASGSKAHRLRALWDLEDNRTVGKLLSDLIDYACDGVRRGALAKECRQIAARVLQSAPATAKAENPKGQGPHSEAKYERLAAQLGEVMAMKPHPRGLAFERFLDDLFAAFELAPRKSFRLVGEQIDGSFHLANETYLVEAKWQDQKIGNRELQAFAGTVRTKASWSRGLYVSYSGFTEEGLNAFGKGDATRFICLEGLELWQILQHRLDLREALDCKARRAAETGRAFVQLRDLFQIS